MGGAVVAGVAQVDWLALPDAELQAQCRFDRFRVSGPGGQHRNRRNTAVRLVHEPTGMVGQATERRSQLQNRAEALQRLRRTMALELRRPVALDSYAPPLQLQRILPRAVRTAEVRSRDRIGTKHREFWNGVQHLLDLFEAREASLADTASALGCSTNQLVRLAGSEPHLLRRVNQMREQRGLGSVRT